MQDVVTPNPSLSQPKSWLWYISIVFFVLIVWTCLSLYGYGIYQDGQITKLKSDLSSLENTVSTLSSDRKTVIANILKDDAIRPSIDLKSLVSAFRLTATKEQVRFQGFSVKNDVISTSLIATEWDPQIHSDPIATIVRFIRSMDAQKQKFQIEPVRIVSGDPTKRTTGIELKVVSAQ